MENTNKTSISNERRGIILMIASVILFTSTSLLLSYMNRAYSINGWVASAYRAAFGLAVVYAMQGKTGKLTLHRVFTRPLLFTRGLLGGSTIPVYYLVIMELGAGRAGMITGSYPLFAALFALFFLREKISRSYYIYIAIALLGLVAIFSDSGLSPVKPVYDGIAMAGAAVAGVCVVLIRHLRHTETTSNIFAAQCVFTLILGVGVGRGEIFAQSAESFGFLVLASVTVIAAQLCITQAFRYINVAKGSTLQMLTPLSTVIASACLLGESFGVAEIMGGAAITFASYKIVSAKKA